MIDFISACGDKTQWGQRQGVELVSTNCRYVHHTVLNVSIITNTIIPVPVAVTSTLLHLCILLYILHNSQILNWHILWWTKGPVIRMSHKIHISYWSIPVTVLTKLKFAIFYRKYCGTFVIMWSILEIFLRTSSMCNVHFIVSYERWLNWQIVFILFNNRIISIQVEEFW